MWVIDGARPHEEPSGACLLVVRGGEAAHLCHLMRGFMQARQASTDNLR